MAVSPVPRVLESSFFDNRFWPATVPRATPTRLLPVVEGAGMPNQPQFGSSWNLKSRSPMGRVSSGRDKLSREKESKGSKEGQPGFHRLLKKNPSIRVCAREKPFRKP